MRHEGRPANLIAQRIVAEIPARRVIDNAAVRTALGTFDADNVWRRAPCTDHDHFRCWMSVAMSSVNG